MAPRDLALSMALAAAVFVSSLFVSWPARAQGAMPLAAVDSSIGHVDVTLDLPKDVPYVGEMILMRVRSTIRGFVTLDELRQPPLTNFNWQQLGRDREIRAMVDGFDVPGIERDIAIFPQRAGRLVIEPFVRHVTMVVGENQRVETDFASRPIYVDVQRHDALGQPGDWWLPAKSVTFTETWTPRADAIEPGNVARRVVSIEAVGMTADGLPPPPAMRAPGIIAFTGPVSRTTILTPDGPIAKATYQWDIRPVSRTPAKLPAIHIPWFDITERRARDMVVPDLWVGYVGTARPDGQAGASLSARLFAPGPLALGLAGFAWAGSLGFLVLGARREGGWRSASPRDLAALRRAARRGDGGAAKAALMRLARADPARWRHVLEDPALAGDLGRLDAALFRETSGTMPALRPFAATFTRRWRAASRAIPRAASPADLDTVPVATGRPRWRWPVTRKRRRPDSA